MSVVSGKKQKLSKLLYNILLHETNSGKYEHKWINGIKEILTSVGRIDLLNARNINNPRAVKLLITRALSDIHIQMWNAKADCSSKAKTYFEFRIEFESEKYLITLPKYFYLPSLNSELEIISSLLRPAVGKIYPIVIENVTSAN